MLRRALLTACLLLAPVSALAKTTREADLALRDARTAHSALKKDTARRKFRHHWLNVADKYELVARGHPKTDRAPEALFAAAQMLEELSRISRNEEDLLRAASDYRKVVELAPRHGLADDAALEVARIQSDLLGRPEDARRTAERALKQLPPGDKTRELRALLAALPADKRRKSGAEGKGASREALLAAMARMGSQEPARTAETAPGTSSLRTTASERRGEEPKAARGSAASAEPASSASGVRAGASAAPEGELRAGRGEGSKASGPKSETGRTDERNAAEPALRAERADTRGTGEGKVSPPQSGERGAAEQGIRADRTGSRDVTAPGSDDGRAGERDARGDGERGAGRGAPAISQSTPGRELHAAGAEDRVGADRGPLEPKQDALRAEGRNSEVRSAAVEIPRDLPVVRAEPRAPGAEAIPEKKLGAREAKARLKAIGGVKDTEVTLAEQLGLKVRRVIIDPGHGGHDSGALGPTGKKEKDVSLAISRKLASRLRAEGLEVLLTRERDTFVRLEDRAQFANDQRGDLFISVHCNSATSRKLRGVETYSLNIASDRYSIRLAARENASSEKSISDLQFILADLATKANTEESTHLATRVQKALVESLAAKDAGLRDLGHKQALFYVLLGAKMPAILVETSFISNPEDERRLGSSKYQDQVAAAIADGVRAFLDNRDRVAQVE